MRYFITVKSFAAGTASIFLKKIVKNAVFIVGFAFLTSFIDELLLGISWAPYPFYTPVLHKMMYMVLGAIIIESLCNRK